jgi:hypothetical protein
VAVASRVQHRWERGISTYVNMRLVECISHGQVNIDLQMARQLEEQFGIPYTVFLQLERERPPASRPPGRPRKQPLSGRPPKSRFQPLRCTALCP